MDREYLNFIVDVFEYYMYQDTTDNFDKRSSVTIRGGRPYLYSPREIGERMVVYFRDCADNGRPFTISCLCLYLGISRQGMLNMEKSSNNQLVDIIKKGKEMVEFYLEYMAQKVPNPAFQIFLLKRMGWSDKMTVENKVNTGMSMKERATAQELIRSF